MHSKVIPLQLFTGINTGDFISTSTGIGSIKNRIFGIMKFTATAVASNSIYTVARAARNSISTPDILMKAGGIYDIITIEMHTDTACDTTIDLSITTGMDLVFV